MISYQLARSAKRKTLAITVKDGQVFVRAPVYVCQSKIDQFLLEKSHWIGRKLKQSVNNTLAKQNAFCQDEGILFAGQTHTLNYQSQQKAPVIATGDYLHVLVNQSVSDEHSPTLVKNALLTYFNQIISEKLALRLPYWIAKTQLTPVTYKIRYYKSRWGSCNSKQQLTFNSLLAMMPDDVIDYIIVHELCHLQHMNHSADFWQLVAQFMPNYDVQKDWIKRHKIGLSVFN